MMKRTLAVLLFVFVLGFAGDAYAAVVYMDASTTSVDNQSVVVPAGISRDNTASDTLYYCFTVTPDNSDFSTENYFGGFEFYNGGTNTVSIGNNWTAFAWSYYGASSGEGDLDSLDNEPGQTYQLVDMSDAPVKFVLEVDYVAGGDDTMTVWLNPQSGVPAAAQPGALTTTLSGDFSFDAIQLRVGNDSQGWDFSGITIATQFSEVVAVPEPTMGFGLCLALGMFVRRRRV